MAWKTHTYEIEIKEKHLDSFGHVNNAVYLELLEEARWEFITEGGFGYKKIQEMKMGPTILSLHIEFKREIHLRQKIKIITNISQYNRKISDIVQEIFDTEGNLMTHAVFKVGLFDMEKRKLITPTQEWLNAVGYQPQSS